MIKEEEKKFLIQKISEFYPELQELTWFTEKNLLVIENLFSDLYEAYILKKEKGLIGSLPANVKKHEEKTIKTSSESAADFFNTPITEIKKNQSVHKIIGAVIYRDKKVTDPFVVVDLIKTKKTIGFFRDIYKEEIEKAKNYGNYLFYYWKENNINFAEFLVKFKQDSTEWESAIVNYYQYFENKYERVLDDLKKPLCPTFHPVKNELTSNPINSFSFYLDYDGWQHSHFVVPKPKEFATSQFIFATYATVFNKTSPPSCGVGLFVKYADSANQIKSIIENNTVEDWIYNLLYNKLLEISQDENKINTIEKLKESSEVSRLNAIKGTWKSYHYRSDKPDGNSIPAKDKGQFELNYLQISPNGQLTFICDENRYNGFISFPIDGVNRFFKGNLQISTNGKIYKLHLFLYAINNTNTLEGVFSGWNSENKPFSSLIWLERMTNEIISDGLSSTLINLKSVSGDQTNHELLSFHSNSEGFFSFPHNLQFLTQTQNDTLISKFSGKYYLLSRNNKQGYFDKAALIIEKNGKFTAQYFDVKYDGEIREIKYENERKSYLFFDIYSKTVENKSRKFGGCFYFSLTNIILGSEAESLHNKIVYLSGLSLRITSTGNIQSKREYLMPAEDAIFSENGLLIPFADESTLVSGIMHNNCVDKKSFDSIFNLLAKNLRGNEENMFLVDPDKPNELPEKEVNYGDVYTNSFLFEALYSKEITSNVYNYLIRAIINVEDTKALILKIEGLCKEFNVQQKIKNDLFGTIIELDKIIVESKSNEASRTALNKVLSMPNDILKLEKTEKKICPLLIKAVEIIREFKRLNILTMDN